MWSTEYAAWVDAQADWTLRRLGDTGARLIVALGSVAWSTLQRVVRTKATFSERGWRDFTVQHPTTLAGEFVLDGVKRTVVRVAHPAWRNKNDPSYAGARRAVAVVLGTRLTEQPNDEIDATRRIVRTAPLTRKTGGNVVGLHFVCRGGLNVKELPNGHFESGVWVVADRHARTAEYLALHESKADPSYRQGQVVGWRPIIHEGRRRFVFEVKPDERRLAWVGDGSGEKGYRYR